VIESWHGDGQSRRVISLVLKPKSNLISQNPNFFPLFSSPSRSTSHEVFLLAYHVIMSKRPLLPPFKQHGMQSLDLIESWCTLFFKKKIQHNCEVSNVIIVVDTSCANVSVRQMLDIDTSHTTICVDEWMHSCIDMLPICNKHHLTHGCAYEESSKSLIWFFNCSLILQYFMNVVWFCNCSWTIVQCGQRCP